MKIMANESAKDKPNVMAFANSIPPVIPILYY